MEEYTNGVVRPVINETITKYKNLINNPLLKDVWTKLMCTKLGRLAQGYQDVTSTNTINNMTYAEIWEIPTDRTVT